MDEGYDIATIGELGELGAPCCAPCAMGDPVGDEIERRGRSTLQTFAAGAVVIGLLVLFFRVVK